MQRDPECARIVYVESLSGFYERLVERKWEQTGHGWYSVGMVKGNLCWKVSKSVVYENNVEAQHGEPSDDGYMSYAKSLMLNMLPFSVHHPHIKMIVQDKEGRYAVLSERLPMTVWDISDTDQNTYNAIEDARWAVTTEEEEFGNYIWSLTKAMVFIRDAFCHSWTFDCHTDNLMIRENGQIVIVDPLSQMVIGDCPVKEVMSLS